MPVELAVPKGERIFSFAGRPQAYIDRDIIVSYESALGNLAQDILWTPQAHKPSHAQHFQVSAGNHSGSPRGEHRLGHRILDRVRDAVAFPGKGIAAVPRILAHQRLAQRLGGAARLRQQLCDPLVHLGRHGPRITASRWTSRRPSGSDEVVLECDPAWNARVQVEILLERSLGGDHGYSRKS